jgi:hypothetical protein
LTIERTFALLLLRRANAEVLLFFFFLPGVFLFLSLGEEDGML